MRVRVRVRASFALGRGRGLGRITASVIWCLLTHSVSQVLSSHIACLYVSVDRIFWVFELLGYVLGDGRRRRRSVRVGGRLEANQLYAFTYKKGALFFNS